MDRARRRPLILDVKGNSLDDGPGIRTVVFFKGCPLDCAWCHNPESKRAGVELAFDPKECVKCETCLSACAEGALDRADAGFVDRRRCTLCFECVEACPSGALSRVGRDMEVSEVIELVKRDVTFFETSGGGVTLSGGEPTLFMDYCSELLRGLKGLGIHTVVETCGYFDPSEFQRLVYPYTDDIYYDLKIFDREEHARMCGVSNEVILQNFVDLQNRFEAGGVPVLARVPLIPGITATDANLESLAGFLVESGANRVAVLQYNPLFKEKAANVGARDPLAGAPGTGSWMSPAEVRRCRDSLKGLEVL